LAAEKFHGIAGINDRDAVIVLERAQVGVAGDDQLGAGGECAGEHGIVVGVALDCRRDVGRDDFARESKGPGTGFLREA
jgi:hypothetical protein